MFKKNLVVCLIVLVINAVPALGASWTGGGDGVSWSDAANWNTDPTCTTVNIYGGTVTVDVDDSISSLRLGEGSVVTLPAGVTLSDCDISESGGLGWVWNPTVPGSEFIVEGTFAFGSNTGNLWLSDGFNSGPSILRGWGNFNYI